MRHGRLLDDPLPFASPSRFTTCRQPHLVLAAAVVTTLISMAVCAAAILAPAPAAAAPVVVALCVGAPMFAGWEVPVALARVQAERAERGRTRALDALRRALAELPEVEHPLGL